eukprot:scaffold12757_cov67-Cyclotella_meneghiniana.AAC.6
MPPFIDTTPISNGTVSITPNLLSKQQVQALFRDAKDLHQNGAFIPGGLRREVGLHGATKTTTDNTTRICDICGIFDDAERVDPSVGNRDARDDLLDLMADLRDVLQMDLGIRLSESMELQYLRYPGREKGNNEVSSRDKRKGFYGRHFDSSPEDESTCRRKVSLLLYLNDETWDAKKDGGVLRVYLPQKKQQMKIAKPKSNYDVRGECKQQDISPEGGTLVMFDSKSVEHEVLPTQKVRWAVVGWFLNDDRSQSVKRNSAQNNRGDGKKRESQSSYHSGEDKPCKMRKKRRKGR